MAVPTQACYINWSTAEHSWLCSGCRWHSPNTKVTGDNGRHVLARRTRPVQPSPANQYLDRQMSSPGSARIHNQTPAPHSHGRSHGSSSHSQIVHNSGHGQHNSPGHGASRGQVNHGPSHGQSNNSVSSSSRSQVQPNSLGPDAGRGQVDNSGSGSRRNQVQPNSPGPGPGQLNHGPSHGHPNTPGPRSNHGQSSSSSRGPGNGPNQGAQPSGVAAKLLKVKLWEVFEIAPADNQDTDCPICQEETGLKTQVIALPCGHWYHEGCIIPWSKTNRTCPQCRVPFK